MPVLEIAPSAAVKLAPPAIPAALIALLKESQISWIVGSPAGTVKVTSFVTVAPCASVPVTFAITLPVVILALFN